MTRPATFPGRCACCGRPYGAGAEIERGAAGWVLASCGAPAPSSGPCASEREIHEVLASARAVAERIEAMERVRARAGRVG